MLHFRHRALQRADLGILAASAILAAWLCIVTEREYMPTYGRQPSWHRDGPTWLPPWLKERRQDAIRLVQGSTAILSASGLGLAVIVLRPRAGRGFALPLSPGAIASVLTGGCLLVQGVAWGLRVAMDPPSPPSGILIPSSGPFALGFFFNLYEFWRSVRHEVTWMILGAWCALAATGRWRHPVDAVDRLGRWLAVGWFILIAGQAAIFVIAWS